VMRKALAWDSIVKDSRLQQQMTQAQAADARDKAKTQGDGAAKAVRAAWSHILYPIPSETPGKAFDLEQCPLSSRDRTAIPAAVYDKVRLDGTVSEKLGGDNLWHALEPIWPEDRPHLLVSEIADWFASFVYMRRLRDRVVLDNAIRDAVAMFDPKLGYADGVDETTGRYRNLVWARNAPELLPSTAVLVRAAEAKAQVAATEVKPAAVASASGPTSAAAPPTPNGAVDAPVVAGASPRRSPRRFYGSVEIDMIRPVKAFDLILNAVVMELQRTQGAKVKLTLEIEGEAPEGFAEGDVSIVRDNAKQLKFKAESTGFED